MGMTYQEARQHFKLKDRDKLNKEGIQELKRIAEKNALYCRLESSKKEAQKDIEACEALLEEIRRTEG